MYHKQPAVNWKIESLAHNAASLRSTLHPAVPVAVPVAVPSQAVPRRATPRGSRQDLVWLAGWSHSAVRATQQRCELGPFRSTRRGRRTAPPRTMPGWMRVCSKEHVCTAPPSHIVTAHSRGGECSHPARVNSFTERTGLSSWQHSICARKENAGY